MELLFPWAEQEGGLAVHWPEGLLYFAVGLVAALVMVYLSAGEFLPAMGSSARVLVLEAEVERIRARHDAILQLREKCAEPRARCSEARIAHLNQLSDDLHTMVTSQLADARAEKRHAQRVGLPLYALLGGLFAVAFADTVAIAIFIGFAWTAIADRIGLKRQESVRDQAKADVATEVSRQVDTLAAENEALQEKVTASDERFERLKQDLDDLGAAGTSLLEALRKAEPDHPLVKEAELG